jgi:IS4 transposase
LPVLTIADLCRYRWQVELFFKWIKQHLRIKAFYGTSENAELSLYTILQLLCLTLFEKMPLPRLVTFSDNKNQNDCDHIQLLFFDS